MVTICMSPHLTCDKKAHLKCIFHLSLALQYFSNNQSVDVRFTKSCSLQSHQGRARASQLSFWKECHKNCNSSQFIGRMFQENYGLHQQLTRTSKRAWKCPLVTRTWSETHEMYHDGFIYTFFCEAQLENMSQMDALGKFWCQLEWFGEVLECQVSERRDRI